MNDDTERTWWLFVTPGGISYVPGDTEGLARRVLAQNQYPGAPVASYTCLGPYRATHASLVESLKTQAFAGEKQG